MITVRFPNETVKKDLVFATGDTVDITSTGVLRISRHSEDALDEQLGAVAPGWLYYLITTTAPHLPPEVRSEFVDTSDGRTFLPTLHSQEAQMPDENEKPAEPTEAQEEDKEVKAPDPSVLGPAAIKAQADDDRWRLEHPNEVRARGPIEGVGGESFAASDQSTG